MKEWMFDEYTNYEQRIRRLSENTLRAYKRDIEGFIDFCQREQLAPQVVTYPVVRAWVNELVRGGIKPRSVNRKLSTMRGYFDFLSREKVVGQNPFTRMRGLRMETKLPIHMYHNEIQEFIDSTGSDFKGLRDKLIFELLYSTGCRVSELVGINTRDLKNSNSFKVKGKGNKERFVYLTSNTRKTLNEYLARRNLRVNAREADAARALLLSNKYARISTRGVFHIITSYASRLGFIKKIGPHTFRHSFATGLVENDADIRIVQELLGHASLSTTQVYTHIGINRLKRIYRQAHPHGSYTNRRSTI